jgi:L-ascorbate metabolism protein UlaG (beta-lactamase superfamily)
MKKWVFRIIGALFGTLVMIIASVLIFEAIDKAVIEKYVKNENLETVKVDWKGVPVDEKGRFVNTEFPFLPSTVDLLKWQFSSKPQKAEKQNDKERLQVLEPNEFLNGEQNGIFWLGHASTLIRLAGKNILIDPVLGEPRFITRYFELPSPIEKIKRVDYVLITHDHRDHADDATVKAIAQKFPEAKFLVGLGMDDLLKEWMVGADKIQTAGWYQQFKLSDESLKITFVPVRHWSRRGLFDTNERLWGGFVIQGAEQTIYHGGDSGYGSHYTEMSQVFPEIDYFLIGIGSYAPRWFMQANHNNPEDALQGFLDSKAKVLVPMHYATFDMSDEPPGEPLRRLIEAAQIMNFPRASGILLHPTSLPSNSASAISATKRINLLIFWRKKRANLLAGFAARSDRLRRFALSMFFGICRKYESDFAGKNWLKTGF